MEGKGVASTKQSRGNAKGESLSQEVRWSQLTSPFTWIRGAPKTLEEQTGRQKESQGNPFPVSTPCGLVKDSDPLMGGRGVGGFGHHFPYAQLKKFALQFGRSGPGIAVALRAPVSPWG